MNSINIKPMNSKNFDLLDVNEFNMSKGLYGRFTISFGEHGKEYLGLYSKIGDSNYAGEAALTSFVSQLRSENCSVLLSRKHMERYIKDDLRKLTFERAAYAYMENDDYLFLVRLTPGRKIDAEIYCYDKQRLVRETA